MDKYYPAIFIFIVVAIAIYWPVSTFWEEKKLHQRRKRKAFAMKWAVYFKANGGVR